MRDCCTADVSVASIVEAMKSTHRKGFGSRSKILYTHPDNLDDIRELVKEVTGPNKEHPDIFIPFPYRVVTSTALPSREIKKTGKIVWVKSNFYAYNTGPAPGSGLSQEEYLSMCLYFGYAVEETISERVWYEIDLSTFYDNMSMRTERPIFEGVPDYEKKIISRC